MPELKSNGQGPGSSSDQLNRRISDDDIRHIFARLCDESQHSVHPKYDPTHYMAHLASAVCTATRADFLILRPVLVLLIAKHNLGRYLESLPNDSAARRTA